MARPERASIDSHSRNPQDAMAGTADEGTVDYTGRVIQMLTNDHRRVQKLFDAAEGVGDAMVK